MVFRSRKLTDRVQTLIDEMLHVLRNESIDGCNSFCPRPVQVSRLEERVLMSAVPMAVIADAAAAVVQPVDTSTGTDGAPAAESGNPVLEAAVSDSTQELSTSDQGLAASRDSLASAADAVRGPELIVIDYRVQDADILLANLLDTDRDVRLLRLDSDQDGLAQITGKLEQIGNVSAVHLLTHGRDGEILLGSTRLNADTLAQYAPELLAWQHSLSANADLLLYACDVAESPEGQDFVESLGLLTGADMAASTNSTGSAALGGDWEFEYRTGVIESTMAFSPAVQEDWHGLLATFVVTNTNDAGGGSLRQAILDANANPGLDTITFNISDNASGHVYYQNNSVAGTLSALTTTTLSDASITDFDPDYPYAPHSWFRIGIPAISGPLVITSPVIIDGYSQPGSTQNTLAAGQNANPRIELTAGSGNGDSGLWFQAGSSGSTVRGLAINNFDDAGIRTDAVVDNVTIQGNFIGTDITGTIDLGNGDAGVRLQSGNNLVGGSSPAERNILSGNNYSGVSLSHSAADNNRILGNYIGVDATGSRALGNSVFGVVIWDGASSNQIGSVTPGEGNIIAYNNRGVTVDQNPTNSESNSIRGNSIYSNTQLGIDLRNDGVDNNDPFDGDTGPNGLQNYPVLTSARVDGTDLTIVGTLNAFPFMFHTLDFYWSPVGDPSGHGEAKTYIGSRDVTTNLSGNASFSATFAGAAIPAGAVITATATDFFANTSEFSRNVIAASSTVQLSAAQDTYIRSSATTLNYGNSTSLIVDLSGGGLGDQRALLQFDLSTIPAGATITGATLQMQATQNGGLSNIDVYQVIEPWVEGSGNGTSDSANWTQSAPGTNWSSSGGTVNATPVTTLYTGATGQHSWDLTTLVQDWVSGTTANNGILLGSQDFGTTTITYDSSEGATPPKLVVSYLLSNTAPVLDGNQSPALLSVNEDAALPSGPVGTLVSSLVDFPGGGGLDNVTDPDAGALPGIAVTGADTSHGTRWYSTNRGLNWNAMGPVSDASALLLAADSDSMLCFQPDPDWNGIIPNAISFHAWDRTSGTPGGVAALNESNVRDQFGSVSYSNNNGTANWASAWVENDSNGGGASGGHIMVSGSELDVRAKFAGDSIFREVDLSGATSAVLSFDYSNTLEASDRIDVQASSDGGASYATVATFREFQRPGTGFASLNLTSFIASNTRIRFLVTSVGGQKDLFIDNVQISFGTGTGGTTAFSSSVDTASLTVNAVNDAPVITSGGGGATAVVNVTENTMAVTTVTAIDVDLPAQTLSYSISGGADAAKFSINSSTGALMFLNPPDFESPADAGLDNIYNVSVQVSDGNGGSCVQAIRVSVTDILDDWRVNTTVADGQTMAKVAMDAAGNYVIVWQNQQADGTWDVYARRYDTAGNPVTGEFQINTYTAGDQLDPDVAMDSAGNFVVTWTSFGQNGDSGAEGSIYARRYNASGTPQGAEFQVNTASGDQQFSAVAMDSVTGNIYVTWSSFGQDGSGWGVYARRLLASGAPASGEFQLNTFTTGDQKYSDIAVDIYGDFVVVWQSQGQDGDGWGVYSQAFNWKNNSLGGNKQINTTTAGDQFSPAVAMEDDGDFHVVWVGQDQAGSRGIFADKFNYSGTGGASKGQYQVNQTTAGEQSAPDITSDPSGNIIFSWMSSGQNGDGPSETNIFARIFRAGNQAPIAQGGEFSVNLFTAGNQQSPAVATDDQGDVVVVWSGNGSGDPNGIFERHYSAFLGNLAPSIRLANAALSYTENGAPILIDGSLTVSDPDSADLAGAIVRFRSGFVAGQDQLSLTSQPGIAGSYNAATGELILTGVATVADYQRVLRTVTYYNTSDNPDTTDRLIEFVVDDGVASGADARTLQVNQASDPPTIVSNGGGSVAAVSVAENSTAVTTVIATVRGLSDLDRTIRHDPVRPARSGSGVVDAGSAAVHGWARQR